VTCTFANGCGKALVGDHGMVNIICTGMLSASAQCICAKLGGFAMIASATKGTPVTGSGSIQESQQPCNICLIIFCFFEMSPARIESNFGMIPGFLTMYAINSDGSPPIG